MRQALGIEHPAALFLNDLAAVTTPVPVFSPSVFVELRKRRRGLLALVNRREVSQACKTKKRFGHADKSNGLPALVNREEVSGISETKDRVTSVSKTHTGFRPNAPRSIVMP
jgi:hypothetical protein